MIKLFFTRGLPLILLGGLLIETTSFGLTLMNQSDDAAVLGGVVLFFGGICISGSGGVWVISKLIHDIVALHIDNHEKEKH